MSELIVIRHGETNWNLERRLQGHVDIPLNQTGLQQARALAIALSGETFDAIICSDLQRAVQTAAMIATRQNLSCQIDPAWRERSFGAFEGELINTLEQRFPVEYAAWRSHDVDSHFPPNGQGCGESIREFHARIERALDALSHDCPNKKIIVVAHGGVLECIYRIANQLPLNAPRSVMMPNAGINRFEFNQGQLKLVQWGDVAHLEVSLDEMT